MNRAKSESQAWLRSRSVFSRTMKRAARSLAAHLGPYHRLLNGLTPEAGYVVTAKKPFQTPV